jgi:predicted permease
MPYRRFEELRDWTTSFSNVAAVSERTVAIGIGEDARERIVAHVGASFFAFFDARPALGRFFTPDEDVAPRGADVALISYAHWQSEYGGRNVLGEPIILGNVRATIVGVTPKGFSATDNIGTPVAYVPATTFLAAHATPEELGRYQGYTSSMFVRRKPGVTVEQASADLSQAFRRSWNAQREVDGIDDRTAEEARARAVVGAVRFAAGPFVSTETRTVLWLTGVSAIVLLIACANVANLFLSRTLRRQREFAVRRALGVGRGRLVAQATVESLVLSVAAASVGLFIAQWGSSVLRAVLMPRSDEPLTTFTDYRTLAITFVATLLTGLITGIVPALFAGRGDLVTMLRSRSGGTQRTRLRAALLVTQVAMSVMLLVGAILFVRSLNAVEQMRMGYDADRVLIAHRVFRGPPPGDSARAALRRALLTEAQAIPGVEAAAWVENAPLFRTSMLTSFFIPGIDSVQRLGSFVSQTTTPDYFRAMGTRILRGRAFNDGDRATSSRVAVVSESMVALVWPGREVIGQCIRLTTPNDPCTTVVGVAEDVVQRTITATLHHIYFPLEQRPAIDGIGLVLRVRDPAAQAEPVRRALQRSIAGTTYVAVAPMTEFVGSIQRSWRLGATMFVAFGVLAIVVAAVGLYGVIAYNVAQRMHELAVRVALGAQQPKLVGLVMGQSLRYAVAGIVLGGLVALMASGRLQPLLYEQSARDPVVYALVATMIIVVAVVASALPASRAARADPNRALRSD